MDYSQKRLKTEWIIFLEDIKFDLGFTLTLKQKRERNDGTIQKLTKSDASKTLNLFFNMLNKKTYVRAYKKSGKSLYYFTAIEDGGYYNDKHIHVHIAIKYPDYAISQEQRDEFKKQVIYKWSKCNWADAQHDIKELYDVNGWIRYIIKEGGDAIDLDNIHLSKNLVSLKNI